jgi:hypothetical protein
LLLENGEYVYLLRSDLASDIDMTSVLATLSVRIGDLHSET